jgi:hypothetical protein
MGVQLLGSLREIRFTHDVIPIKNGSGFMPSNCHGNFFWITCSS